MTDALQGPRGASVHLAGYVDVRGDDEEDEEDDEEGDELGYHLPPGYEMIVRGRGGGGGRAGDLVGGRETGRHATTRPLWRSESGGVPLLQTGM